MGDVFYTEESVIRTSKRDVARMRKQLKKSDKKLLFALAVAEVCDAYDKSQRMDKLLQLTKFEIHHIIPLGLGGTNQKENLALVEPKQHVKIHQLIQTQGEVDYGRRSKIPIPRMNGFIWGLE